MGNVFKKSIFKPKQSFTYEVQSNNWGWNLVCSLLKMYGYELVEYSSFGNVWVHPEVPKKYWETSELVDSILAKVVADALQAERERAAAFKSPKGGM